MCIPVYKLLGGKINIRLCKYDYQPRDGYYEVPERPGIGQELTDEAIEAAEKITVSGQMRFS